MKAQLKQALIASGRYFTFKEQMEVRGPTSITRTLKLICNHFWVFSSCWQQTCKVLLFWQPAVVRVIRNVMQRREPFTDQQELSDFINKLYVCLVDQTYVALNKVNTPPLSTLSVQSAYLHPLCFSRSIHVMLKMTLWMRFTWVPLSCSILPGRLRLLGIISWLFSTTKRWVKCLLSIGFQLLKESKCRFFFYQARWFEFSPSSCLQSFTRVKFWTLYRAPIFSVYIFNDIFN